jgi:repressor LexA
MQLTERQQEIFDYIVSYRQEHGCSPSIPELQEAFGIRSPNGVAGHLHALEAKGLIWRANRGSRQVEIAGEEEAKRATLCNVPVWGSIAAGMPATESQEAAPRYVTVDQATLGFRPGPGTFALRVRGDSMRDAGILHGDLVVVQPGTDARLGQIVVALLDGENTLKRLVQVGRKYYLKAENPAYPDLHPRSALAIQGVVRAVIRQLS